MSDDLTRAQRDLDDYTAKWGGESAEQQLLRRVLRVLSGKGRGPYMRVVNSRPTWTPSNGEPCIDRTDAVLYVGFDGQWYATPLTPIGGTDGA